jgi:ADP-L-glycero-D-manno-heptose 6-epimerase
MILVTGGAGFIGSNIVAALNEGGRYDVAICDALGVDEKWRNLRKRAFVEFIAPADLLAWLAPRRDIEAIIHMGAISATTALDADEVVKTNFVLSVRLLDYCSEQGVPFLYASSAAVYGAGDQGFEDANDVPSILALQPLNLYGWSKRQFDLVVAHRMSAGRLPPRCTGFRFFNVFGPNEHHKGDMASVVSKLAPKIANGETISLFKSHKEGVADGDQRRDFIYVQDAVSVVLWALGPEGRSGVFNVGTGVARSFRELAEAVFDTLALPRRIEYRDMPAQIRDRYQYFTQASLHRLRQAGYAKPFMPLEDAVADYVSSYLLSADPYR